MLVWRADYVPPAARAFLALTARRPANLCGIEGSQAPPHEESVDIRAIAKRAGFFVIVLVAAVVLILSLPGIGEIRDRFSSADPRWLVAAAICRVLSMLGFVRALWSVFDRVMPWRRALVLGLAEQGANVLCPRAARAARRSARSC